MNNIKIILVIYLFVRMLTTIMLNIQNIKIYKIISILDIKNILNKTLIKNKKKYLK